MVTRLPTIRPLLQAEGLQTPSLGWHSPLEIGETSESIQTTDFLGLVLKVPIFQTFRMCNLFIKTHSKLMRTRKKNSCPMIWLKPALLLHSNMVFFKIHKGAPLLVLFDTIDPSDQGEPSFKIARRIEFSPCDRVPTPFCCSMW